MHHLHNPQLEDCIRICQQCHDECQDTLFNYCLTQGGKHVEESHVRLMADCIEICRVSADFMGRDSAMHAAVCAACAEICEACAKSCEAIDDQAMKHCAEICRRCAKSCRDMGKGFTRKAA